jgi:hypothetical protein
MHAAEVLAWVRDGAVFCPDCKPAPTSRAAAIGHDDVSPWFGDDEAALSGSTCDGCSCFYVAGDGWQPHDAAPHYAWARCDACNAQRPVADYRQARRDAWRGRLVCCRGARVRVLLAAAVAPRPDPVRTPQPDEATAGGAS